MRFRGLANMRVPRVSLTICCSLQVNVISTGLLATLLLPSMQRTTSLPAAGVLKPHLVIVASDGARANRYFLFPLLTDFQHTI